MNIRSILELQEALNKELAWRKRELTSILSYVSVAQGNSNIQLSIRSSVLLLYAHWEGFVKLAAEYYLIYVRNQNLQLSDLSFCFLAIALKQKIQLFEATKNSTKHGEFVNYVRGNLNEPATFSTDSVINASSNLNSVILEQILTSIGIDYSPFELKANLLDQQLLKYRNTIAHGEYLSINRDEYKIIHKEIFAMINEIKNRIENCAALESYKLV